MEKLLAIDLAYTFKTITTKWYYYIALGVFAILLFCLFFFKKQSKRNNLKGTQKLVYISLFIALATVLNIFDIKVSDVLQISFVATVGFIGGYLFGGGWGFVICFVGDLIGAIIRPNGPYNPIIGIGTGCWGLIPGIAFGYFGGNDKVKIAISFAVCFLIISAGINTLGFCLMYPSRYTFGYLLPLLPIKLLVAFINCVLCMGLTALLPRILPKDKFTV